MFMVYLITKATSLLFEGQIFQAYLFYELITPDVVISHKEMASFDRGDLKFIEYKPFFT